MCMICFLYFLCIEVSIVFLCPQDVVEEVSAAKHLFDQASDILGYDLLKLCVEGVTSSNMPWNLTAPFAALQQKSTWGSLIKLAWYMRRSKGEAGLHSDLPASNLCGQSSSC